MLIARIALLVLTLFGTYANGQIRQSCALEAYGFRSTGGSVPLIDDRFTNLSSTTISIYWLDYQGNRVLYNTLAPGQSYLQSTWLSHPWLITNSSGNCLGIWLFTAGGQGLIVSSPLPLGDSPVPEFNKWQNSVSCPAEGAEQPVNIAWGRFGLSPELIDGTGARLKIVCGRVESSQIDRQFVLRFTNRTNTLVDKPIALCVFPTGCNSFYFKSVGISYHPDTGALGPGVILETVWITRDYGSNTLPNPTTSRLLFPDYELTEQLLDWEVWNFLPSSEKLSRTLFRYDYAFGPPVPLCGERSARREGPVRETRYLDPQLGPETDAIFNELVPILNLLPPGQSSGGYIGLADLNSDGRTDAADFAFFQVAFGSCSGQVRFDAAADLDGDTCVTLKDYQAWFAFYRQESVQ